jgi:GDPmannose 4,6-dehydratase
MKRTALIFGIDGQDGSYLAEFLLEKSYQVIGWTPSGMPLNQVNLATTYDRIRLVQGSLMDPGSVADILVTFQPDEIYNLASPSFTAGSWAMLEPIGEITALGVARILEGIRLKLPRARFFQASSSEMFGNPHISPQNEDTPFNPRNPYGIAKTYAHWMTACFRENYGIYAVSGILFNHESPRRGLQFVSRKISDGAARIFLGLATELRLGNLEARRDWSFAGDVVRAMWLMLQADHPEDYVIGSGTVHSVMELCQVAFSHLGLDYRQYVRQDEQFYRPNEPVPLVANPLKAQERLGWRAEVTFEEMIRRMVEADVKKLSDGSK